MQVSTSNAIVARITAGAIIPNEMELRKGGVSIDETSSSSVTITHNLGRVPKFVMCRCAQISASNADIGAGTFFCSCAAADGMQIATKVTRHTTSSIDVANSATNTALLSESTGFIQAANEQTFRLSPSCKIAEGTLYWYVLG